MKIIKALLVFTLITNLVSAQNDTSTPYSIFGLGVENKTASGGLTGLGNTGIAQNKPGEINLYNPASLGQIELKTFLYEFGINGMSSTIKTNYLSENTTDFNISHVIMAFPVNKNLGLSFGLLPYTKVGYDIDLEQYIEGSETSYTNRITGSGGLTKFYVAGGFNITKALSLGVDLTYLFGSINQESNIYYESLVNITDENQYRGFKFKTGLQYNILKQDNLNVNLGGVLELPAHLKGNQLRSSNKTLTTGTYMIIESDEPYDLGDFELPLTYGFGVTSTFNNTLTTSFDFTKLNWNDTNQSINKESYTNQSIYAFGAEYSPITKKSYWSNVDYRFGLNYNTGFLTIADTQIDSYFVSAGLGLPLSDRAKLNIAYSYGTEGTVNNDLVAENYHKLTLNLSFIGSWFNKTKYN
ncbi:hypothetical protein PK35_07005 [Tamlana nanhaiensis]|uniref:Aromatic hydrocarbon degradation membrane protein n=1 Tax=Neotamlana nanhaiensis TaxID=1382798 RepID=A0A0D7W3A5_9FLAO|nr:hypothetical protein [Tamlana nanhaiensis]KJD33581.1 hypothetical protein PK35_07005 [Tamlana nanhaiensis]